MIGTVHVQLSTEIRMKRDSCLFFLPRSIISSQPESSGYSLMRDIICCFPLLFSVCSWCHTPQKNKMANSSPGNGRGVNCLLLVSLPTSIYCKVRAYFGVKMVFVICYTAAALVFKPPKLSNLPYQQSSLYINRSTLRGFHSLSSLLPKRRWCSLWIQLLSVLLAEPPERKNWRRWGRKEMGEEDVFEWQKSWTSVEFGQHVSHSMRRKMASLKLQTPIKHMFRSSWKHFEWLCKEAGLVFHFWKGMYMHSYWLLGAETTSLAKSATQKGLHAREEGRQNQTKMEEFQGPSFFHFCWSLFVQWIERVSSIVTPVSWVKNCPFVRNRG